MKPLLGPKQFSALRCLVVNGRWPGAWTMGTDSETIRLLDSLGRRGLAEKNEREGTWRPTDAGRALIKKPVQGDKKLGTIDEIIGDQQRVQCDDGERVFLVARADIAPGGKLGDRIELTNRSKLGGSLWNGRVIV